MTELTQEDFFPEVDNGVQSLKKTQREYLDPELKAVGLYCEKSLLKGNENIKKRQDLNKTIKKTLFREKDFTERELKDIPQIYKKWVDQPVYLTYQDLETGEYLHYLGAKRGNSVYSYHLKKHLDQETSFITQEFFNKYGLRDKPGFRNTLKKQSNILFCTATWDPDIFLGNRKKAWMSIDYYYNKFITRLRKKYGRCYVIKSIESTKKQYPHMHLLIIFENETFNCFEHRDKKTNKISWRADKKIEIAKLWKRGWFDVKVPYDLPGLKNYIFKDLIKSYSRKQKTQQDYSTLSLTWIFRKQSFSISNFDKLSSRLEKGIIQTQMEEIALDLTGKTIKFIGLMHIIFRDGIDPPFKFISRMTEERLAEFIKSYSGNSDE